MDITVQTISTLGGKKQKELKQLWIHGVARDTHAVGWLPVSAFETRAAADDIVAVYRNEELVGWTVIATSKSRAIMRLYQIWVRPDARVLEHGRALVDAVRTRGIAHRCHRIEAWVGEDLPANLFWSAIGFTRSNWRWGRGKKPRKIFLWTTPTLQLGAENYVGKYTRHTLGQGTTHAMAEA